jgi:hypothetical protein
MAHQLACLNNQAIPPGENPMGSFCVRVCVCVYACVFLIIHPPHNASSTLSTFLSHTLHIPPRSSHSPCIAGSKAAEMPQETLAVCRRAWTHMVSHVKRSGTQDHVMKASAASEASGRNEPH